jgi:CxxC motif-containing protein (DUF1111 family)
MRTGLTSQVIAVVGVASFCAISLVLFESASRVTHASTANVYEESGRYLGDPVNGLTPDQLQEFDDGFKLFIKNWTVEEGLGPHVNARSCVTCHRIPTPGGSGTGRETFVLHSPAVVDALGGSVFQRFDVLSNESLGERTHPKQITVRRSQSLFGLGLLEAVPVTVLQEYADPNDSNGDGISGRLVKVGSQYGRFGWKGNIPTIEAFVEDAFAVELGLTNRSPRKGVQQGTTTRENGIPIEVSSTQIRLVSQFIRFLGAPRPTGRSDFSRGQELFFKVECNACHRPTLTTGPSPQPFANQKLLAFTDLLLHDMGSELADGLAENGVSEQEFRTPPLWGIASTGPPYLHDGRAATIYDAIIVHGGEAKRSVAKFKSLSSEEQAAVVRFINSL